MKKLFMGFMCAMVMVPVGARAIESSPLESLKIEGINADLNVNKQVNKARWCGGNSVNIIAKANNSGYSVTGAGRVNVNNGDNEIKVVVTDPADNSSYTYTINLSVNPDSCGKSGVASGGITNPKTGAIIPFAAIGGGSGLVYLINKKTKKTKKINRI